MRTSGCVRPGMRDVRGGHGMPRMKDIREGHGIDICHKERTNYMKENTGTIILKRGDFYDRHLISILYIHIRT